MAVLVTGVGGPAGVAVVEALKSSNERIIGVDADEWASGFGLVDSHEIVPLADDSSYIDALVNVAEKHGAFSLIPTVAEELETLRNHQDELSVRGLSNWIPEVPAIIACNDKRVFADRMFIEGVPHPPTYTSIEEIPYTDEGAWVVKPASGRGSRSVSFHKTLVGVEEALNDLNGGGIAQTRLLGREFTADALTDRKGNTLVVVPRWRIATKAGISTMGETFANSKVDTVVRQAISATGLTGPSCVQGFVSDNDEVNIVEINPRFSGGLPLSIAAGADLVGQYLNGIRGVPFNLNKLSFQPGVRMSRYFSAVYSTNGNEWISPILKWR